MRAGVAGMSGAVHSLSPDLRRGLLRQRRHRMPWLPLTGLVLALALLGATALTTRAEGPFTPEDTLIAIDTESAEQGVSHAVLTQVVGCETGWTFDPASVGDGGLSIGAAQLHRYGLRSTFYAWGYTDPWNPYQAIAFMGRAFNAGMASHWTCYRIHYGAVNNDA